VDKIFQSIAIEKRLIADQLPNQLLDKERLGSPGPVNAPTAQHNRGRLKQ
jgi:hypothetical protein